MKYLHKQFVEALLRNVPKPFSKYFTNNLAFSKNLWVCACKFCNVCYCCFLDSQEAFMVVKSNGRQNTEIAGLIFEGQF